MAKIGGRTKKRTIHRTIPGRKGHSPALRKRCVERVLAGEKPDAVARSEGVSAWGIQGWVRDKDKPKPVKGPRKLKPETLRFCQLVATPRLDGSSRSNPEAYCEAYGCKPNGRTDDQTQKLLKRADVQAEIAKIRKRLQKRMDITAEQVLGEIAKIAFADAGCYFDWGPDGVTVKPSESLNADQTMRDTTAAVSEVSETTTKDGGTVRVKLHDKLGALDKLGRHLGLFQDKVDVTSGGKPILSDGERLERLAKLLDAARARRDGPAAGAAE